MPKFGEVFLAQIKQYLEDFPKFLIYDQTGSKNEEPGRDKLGDWGLTHVNYYICKIGN